MEHPRFRKPFRAVPLRHAKTGTVIPFARARRKRRKLRLVPVLVMAPLAVLTALAVRHGVPDVRGFTAPDASATKPLVREQRRPPIFAERQSRIIDYEPPRDAASAPEAVHFGKCWGRHGDNCVIDGDSLIYAGRQIRVADIDAPELGHPRCAEERALGEAAEDRLRDLLNAGPFTLEPTDRAEDRYGRALFVLTRDGRSLGGTLVDEGLAHPWVGHKEPWC